MQESLIADVKVARHSVVKSIESANASFADQSNRTNAGSLYGSYFCMCCIDNVRLACCQSVFC